jgi:hypothetical protein
MSAEGPISFGAKFALLWPNGRLQGNFIILTLNFYNRMMP